LNWKNELLRFILNGFIKDWNSWKKCWWFMDLKTAWRVVTGDSSSYSWQATLRTRTWRKKYPRY
jgi:hypothetical protein